MEAHANFKNKWLSNYHDLEEGEEKRHEGGHTRRSQSEKCEPNWDQVIPLNLGNFLTKCSIIFPGSIQPSLLRIAVICGY